MLGVSTVSYDYAGIERCRSFCKWLRMVLSWNSIQPTLETWQWESADRCVTHAKNLGYKIILDIGDGFSSEVPLYNGSPFLPNGVGNQKYLKHLQDFVIAITQRYGNLISIFQIEREVNQAFLTGLWGWRDFSLGGSWKDWGFVTEIITSLSVIIRNAGHKITTQIHTDIHPNLNKSIKTPSWLDAITQWAPHLDFIGISAYPNYIRATPVYSIQNRIHQIQKITQKPIIVLETGYPVASGPQSQLRSHSFSNQRLYVEKNIMDCMKSGVHGYFYFSPHAGIGFSYSYTSQDLYALEKLALCMETGDIRYFYQILSNPGLSYVQNIFPNVLQSTERGFIMFDINNNPLPATQFLMDIYSHMTSFTWNLRRGNNLLAFPIKPMLSTLELFKQMNASVMIYVDSEGNFKNHTDRDGEFEVTPGIGYLFVIREARTFTYWGTTWE